MRLLILFVAFILAPSLVSADWKLTIEKLVQSTVLIETSQGTCSGFVINEPEKLVLTAAHCYDAAQMFIDGKPLTKVIDRDLKKDLIVVFVDGLDKPALPLGKENPAVGDQVASYGYGHYLNVPLFRRHTVSASDVFIDKDGPHLRFDSALIAGMSGGPIVTEDGLVVSIVQLGSNTAGLGVGVKTIRDSVGKYFQVK